MVPIDGGNRFSDDPGPANVGGEGVGHGLVAPRVLQDPDASIGGNIEAIRKGHISGHMATRHIHPTEEAVGYLSR